MKAPSGQLWWYEEFFGGSDRRTTWIHAGLAAQGYGAVLPADVGVGGEAPGPVAQASGVPAEVVRVL